MIDWSWKVLPAPAGRAAQPTSRTIAMTAVLPSWIDKVEGVDFTPEKELLRDLEQWATQRGWQVSDGSDLPSELQRRTDVLLSQSGKERYMRIAVLPKTKRGTGVVRID